MKYENNIDILRDDLLFFSSNISLIKKLLHI